jgi:hypothetical protein
LAPAPFDQYPGARLNTYRDPVRGYAREVQGWLPNKFWGVQAQNEHLRPARDALTASNPTAPLQHRAIRSYCRSMSPNIRGFDGFVVLGEQEANPIIWRGNPRLADAVSLDLVGEIRQPPLELASLAPTLSM